MSLKRFSASQRHRRDVPLRRLSDVPPWRRWVFHLRLVWDVVETYQWHVDVTYPWDVVTTFLNGVLGTYHWDALATFHWDVVGCFTWDVPARSLGRTKRCCHDVVTTSTCRIGRFNSCYFAAFSLHQWLLNWLIIKS